jgi:hypothetical protein
VVAVNATVVICLQYIVGKRITHEYLNQWLTAGFSLFLLGVVGFALSTTVLHWALAVAIAANECSTCPLENAGYLTLMMTLPFDLPCAT